MRILHVVPYYTDAWAYGGIPRLATAMARGLARHGHDVTVCTTDVADADTRAPSGAAASEGVSVRVFRNVSNRLAYRWQFFTPLGLRRFVRDEASAFDVGHIHACHNLPGVIAASALRRAGVPYVVSPNGTALRIERRRAAKLAFDTLVGRDLLPRASRVLAVTEAERRQLHAAGVHDRRIRIVPNPIDLREFDSHPEGVRFRREFDLGRDPLVLYLGKLTPRKGVDVLVRAFSRVTTAHARLVIAGNDMGGQPAIARAIRNAGAGARVAQVGLLRGPARLDALAAADVAVYPSRDEIFGIVPLEALLCGRPVIVGDDGGCAEVIRQTGGGRIVCYGDHDALASAIDDVLTHPAAWRARAEDAAVRVREAYATDVVCARLENVYEEVCA